MRETLSSYEDLGRAIMRVVLAFMLFLHGLREVFGMLPNGGRRNAVMALDTLGSYGGMLLLLCGLLLFIGLLTRPVAAILCIQTVVAYIHGAAPRGPLPLRNGGEEVVAYCFIMLYLAFAGAGKWSLDSLLSRRKLPESPLAPASAG